MTTRLRLLVLGLVGLAARSMPASPPRTIVIRQHGGATPVLTLKPKEDVPLRPRTKLQPPRSKMNRYAATRVYRIPGRHH